MSAVGVPGWGFRVPESAPLTSFTAVGSCDDRGRVRLGPYSCVVNKAPGGCLAVAAEDGVVVLTTNWSWPPRGPVTHRDDRGRLLLGRNLSRSLPPGPQTLIRYQAERHRLTLMDEAVAGTWLDAAIEAVGCARGWWS